MKKIICIFLAVTLLLIAAGCSTTENGGTETVSDSDTVTDSDTAADSDADTDSDTDEVDEFDPSQIKLGYVMFLKGHPVIQLMSAGFMSEAEELGYDAALYQCDEADAAKALQLGEVALANGVKGFVIFNFDTSINTFAEKVKEAGGFIVVGHTPLDKEEYPLIDAWAACDPGAYGEAAAEAIAAEVGGKGTLAITQGDFVPNENEAAAAFTAYINENYPDMTVLDPVAEGFDTAIAVSTATAIIQANPDIVGAFSTTGGGPQTWAGAKEETGRDDLVCIGMDYTEENLDLVKNGKIFGLIAQPIFEEHAFAVDLLDKLLRGETVEYDNLMDAPVITVDDLDKYYGYLEIVKEAFGDE